MFLGNNNTESNLQQPILQGNNVNINVDEEATSVVEAVATKVTPSVIGIRTTTSVMSFFGNQQSSGEGSGVVYKQDGYIITNYHVISDAIGNSSSKIEVFLDNDKDAESYEASVVGYNISSDLAVVKINATGLTPIEIADSSDLKVGQYVITVGNPGGLEFMDSVTYGVISGLNRIMSSDSEIPLIQTDAAINPGNSGGALVNTSGKLVGINSAKIVSEEFEGMGFAIPSNTVVEICNKIIEKENSPEPYIGVTLSEKYTAQMLMLYGYPKGAVILTVADGSPAYQTGIRKGDIITEFNGTVVEDYKQFNELFEKVKPGEEITVKIYRNGKYYSAKLKIGSNNSVQ
jgi:serine protease Do